MARSDYANAESSGGLRNFVLTVTNAFFAVDPNYSAKVGADTHFLHWEGTSDVESYPVMDSTGFHPKWSLDTDFMSADGGKTVISQSGKGERVGKAYGRMCKAAADLTEHLAGTPEDFLEKGSPLDASIWVGTMWRMDDVEFGSGQYKTTQLMPVEFVGFADSGAPASAPAAATGESPLRQQVIDLAKASADYVSFQKAALALPNVTSDPGLVTEIATPTGIYASVNGG